MLINLFAFIISALITRIAIPFLYNMLLSNGCTSLNYNKKEIPLGMGLIFVLIQSFVVYIFLFFLKTDDNRIYSYIIAILLMGLVGIIDDIIGEKEIKGFKGHMRALLKGKLTTGGVKAIVGFFISILISLLISGSYLELILNTLVIALFTNLINLFDLRPGRASKVFIFLAIVLIITGSDKAYGYIIFSALGIIAIYIPYDLKSLAMMGDVGSNALGITLGLFCIFTHTITLKLIYFILLLFLHIISENYSFSKIISKNRFLNYLDSIGRDII